MQKADVVGVVLRLWLAIAFGLFGYEKIVGDDWVEMFRQIGFGDWFRYFTGGLQVLGASLMLHPRTARSGAAVLAATMLGAMGVHVFILPTGVGGALIPAVFLGFTSASLWRTPRGEEAPLSLR